MNESTRKALVKYVEPGKTIVRYESEDKTFVSYGIAMENFPHVENDRVTCGFVVPDMIQVTWFDGNTDTFPVILLDFDVDGDWLDMVDLEMGEEAS